MMKRQIFPWVGLIVLIFFLGLSQETLAQEIYKVKRGDTLAQIAKKYGLTPEALREANALQGSKLKIHQALTIPGQTKKIARTKAPSSRNTGSYTVKKGDTLDSIARKTGITAGEIREMNNLRGNSLKRGQKIVLAKIDKNPGKAAKDNSAADDLEEEDGDLSDDLPGSGSLAEADKNGPANTELLGKWHDPEERKLFVKVATAFLGAPYRLGGISLKGLDCSAYVKKIYQLFDISLPRTAREQARVGIGVDRDELTEGDLVFFNTRRSFGHVGIYIGNNEFVHASSRNKGVRIDSLNTPYFNKRFIKAVRLKGLEGYL